MLGRVIDGAGRPLDGKPAYRAREHWPLFHEAPLPLSRMPIREPLGCGIRAIDGFVTCGRGQRVGLFGGSGVGKSTLIGMMARGTSADLTVLALVGERGREVRDFLEDALGEDGLRRSVVVVSTSDQSPLLRIRAALTAVAIAGGLAGATADSLIGATIQAMFFCPACNKETERHPLHSCGTPTVRLRGWPWLRNDGVNLGASLIGAAVAAAVYIVWGGLTEAGVS